MTDDLIAFLRARLDEDEAAARATSPTGRRLSWATDVIDNVDCDDCYRGRAVTHGVISVGDVAGVAEAFGLERGTGEQVAVHIARHDPDRALREVEFGRAILLRYKEAELNFHPESMSAQQLGAAMAANGARLAGIRDLAAIWSDHPDYRKEWQP